MGDYSNYTGAECGKITLVSSFSNKLHLKFETAH